MHVVFIVSETMSDAVPTTVGQFDAISDRDIDALDNVTCKPTLKRQRNRKIDNDDRDHGGGVGNGQPAGRGSGSIKYDS